MQRQQLPGLVDGLIRLSVGIEDVDDLWDDLAQAMERWTGSRQPAAEEGLVQR